MPRSLHLTATAIADIESLRTFYALEAGWSVSAQLDEAIRECVHRLAEFPMIGVERPERHARLRGLRWVLVPGFPKLLLFYRVTPETVDVIRVCHGAREQTW